jgi:hypothetical protein
MVGVDCRISERIKERVETEFRNAPGFVVSLGGQSLRLGRRAKRYM